jgi:hypothetical protein
MLIFSLLLGIIPDLTRCAVQSWWQSLQTSLSCLKNFFENFGYILNKRPLFDRCLGYLKLQSDI